jgi:hypothetical protein
VSSQGSAYARFQRALKTGNLTLIRNAAGELPQMSSPTRLPCALPSVTPSPERFERAALRWLARFCLERPDATLARVQ